MNGNRKAHRALSYANVMATLAVFVALGGSSYAALKITGKHVRNNSLTGADLRNNSVTSADVRNGSLGAKDFKAGAVPKGPGNPGMWSYRRDLHASFDPYDLPDIPGLAQLTFVCEPEPTAVGRLYIRNTSGTDIDSVATIATDIGPSRLERLSLEAGGGGTILLGYGVQQVVWQIRQQTDSDPGKLATVTVNHVTDKPSCHFSAMAFYQDAVDSASG